MSKDVGGQSRLKRAPLRGLGLRARAQRPILKAIINRRRNQPLNANICHKESKRAVILQYISGDVEARSSRDSHELVHFQSRKEGYKSCVSHMSPSITYPAAYPMSSPSDPTTTSKAQPSSNPARFTGTPVAWPLHMECTRIGC